MSDLEFSLDSLTIGELEALEERLGLDLDAIVQELNSGQRSARLLRAVVWLVRRRSDPEFTWEQAGDVRITEVELPRPRTAGAEG